jgi:pyruvate,orthophosphate dikinase
MLEAYARVDEGRADLEKHFKDVQDVEFTVQDGKLFMLQTRNGKRTAAAALQGSPWTCIKEKLIDWETACCAIPPISSTSSSPDLRRSPR